jgi:outer membrane receptor protein involved in Fe transport
MSLHPIRSRRPSGLKPFRDLGCIALLTCSTVPDTALAAETQSLSSVTVSGKTSTVQTLVDRKVYKLGEEVQALTGSAADVLNTLPSVNVDIDGNVSLRGDSNVLILVDGQPSAQLSGSKGGDGLLQLSAKDIDRIEVMSNPPAQYKAAGTGGVINIVTRKNREAGASGTAQFSAGNKNRYVLGLNGGYGAQAFNLTGALGLREDERERNVHSLLVSAPGPNADSSSQVLNEHIRRLVPSFKLGADGKLSERQSLSANFSYRQRDGNRFFDQHDEDHSAAGQLLASSDRHSDGHEWSRSQEQGLRFKQALRDAGETLEASLHQSTDFEREHYTYHNTAQLPPAPVSIDRLFLNHDLRTDDLGLDYARALTPERSLKFGYALQHDDNGFDYAGDNADPLTGLFIPNTTLTNRFRYRQTLQAVYASYQAMLEDWSLVAGLRGEHSAHIGQQIDTGRIGRHGEGDIYPSLSLERAVDDTQTWSVGYSKRVSRPDGEALNPFIDAQDTHNLRAGNPDLLPQKTQSLELGYRLALPKQSYGWTGYWRETRNSVTTLTQAISPDVTLSTLSNLPRSRALGMEFNADGPLGAVLAYRLSGNLFYSQIDASALGFPGLRSTAGLNLKASLDYRPTAADTAQISVSRTDKRLTPQGEVAAINLVNLGYKHQVQPDLAVFATVSDLFNGQRFQRTLDTAALLQTYQRQQQGRIVFVGLSYSFGGGKKSKGAAFDYDKGEG